MFSRHIPAVPLLTVLGSMVCFACGRQARHHAANDVIFRAMCSAGVPSTKEPAGLLRDDGKRPGGLSPEWWWQTGDLGRHSSGPCCSLLHRRLTTPSPAAEQAAARKTAKYSQLSTGFIFECLGAMNSSSASDFLGDLGHRLARITGERRCR